MIERLRAALSDRYRIEHPLGRTTANLQHPHILPLFDSGDEEGFLWYVRPYVKGPEILVSRSWPTSA